MLALKIVRFLRSLIITGLSGIGAACVALFARFQTIDCKASLPHSHSGSMYLHSMTVHSLFVLEDIFMK
jgi:hypothetical protein